MNINKECFSTVGFDRGVRSIDVISFSGDSHISRFQIEHQRGQEPTLRIHINWSTGSVAMLGQVKDILKKFTLSNEPLGTNESDQMTIRAKGSFAQMGQFIKALGEASLLNKGSELRLFHFTRDLPSNLKELSIYCINTNRERFRKQEVGMLPRDVRKRIIQPSAEVGNNDNSSENELSAEEKTGFVV